MPSHLRLARDEDSAGLIQLIAVCWAEYPGCVLDVDAELPHLYTPATSFARWDGQLWVAEENDRITGSVGFVPSGTPRTAELRMLYVMPEARRQRLGSLLLRTAEQEAAERGLTEVELWSDTRFITAHRFYERHGYHRTGAVRELHDLSNSLEFHFRSSRKDTGSSR